MDTFTHDSLFTTTEREDSDSSSRLIRYRLKVCATALVGGLAFAVVPVPYLVAASVTQTIIAVFSIWSSPNLQWILPSLSLTTYLALAGLVTLGLTMPLLIFQGLALAGPLNLRHRRLLRAQAALLLYAPFSVGFVIAGQWWHPILSTLRDSTSEYIPGLTATRPDECLFVVGLAFLVGFAFQLPLWPSVLTRLRIARYSTLAKSRRYVLLAAVFIAALVTPTTDLTTMAMIAVPLYLIYELGLLIARFTAPPLRAGEGAGGGGSLSWSESGSHC